MAAPLITPLPTPPKGGDTDFDKKADAFTKDLYDAITELNALGTYVENNATDPNIQAVGNAIQKIIAIEGKLSDITKVATNIDNIKNFVNAKTIDFYKRVIDLDTYTAGFPSLVEGQIIKKGSQYIFVTNTNKTATTFNQLIALSSANEKLSGFPKVFKSITVKINATAPANVLDVQSLLKGKRLI